MIRCSAVTAAYNGSRVLDGVDLTVSDGEWVAIIGPNGAGKSTLLRVIAGTVGAAGEVMIGDTPVAGAGPSELATTVAVVPQQPVVPEGMTVLDYALLGRSPYIPWWGVESPEDLALVDGVLERVDMAALAGRRLDQLSGGELQRAILARALAQDTPVLLLDEPTAALDIGHQQQVLELIDELRRERGLTVLSAFHDLSLAGQYADRLVLLVSGQVVTSGAAPDVLRPELLREHYGATVKVTDDGDGNLIVSLRRP